MTSPKPSTPEELPSKRKRVPVLPPPPPSSKKEGAKGKPAAEEAVPDANEDVEVLLRYFNDRVAPSLAM